MPFIVTQDTLQEFLELSMQKPVFCLFYMEGPEHSEIKNLLTTSIADNNAYVSLALCSLEDRAVQYLAMQVGLQDAPSVVVIDKGNPKAILEGAEEIKNELAKTINSCMPSEGDLLIREALEAEASGNIDEACNKAQKAYESDQDNITNKFIYIRLLIATKQITKARELLDNARREEQLNPDYRDLLAALDLAEQSANSPEFLEIENKYNQDPNDENAVAYAIALSSNGKKIEALDILLNKLKQDLAKEEVKKTYLDILSTMNGTKEQSAYRRKLYTLMY